MALTKGQLDLLLENNQITEEDYNVLLVDLTPSLWIETHICDFDAQIRTDGSYPGLTLRWYQREMVDCPSGRRVARLGRQCLSGKSKITMIDGSSNDIKNTQIGDKVFSFNESLYAIEEDIVEDKWSNGIRKTYKIKTKFGREILATDNHPFFINKTKLDKSHGITIDKSKGEWLTIKDGLTKGMKIAVPHKLNIKWDYISSIEYIGKEEVFHISVSKNNTFIANDIITHNSGKTHIIAADAIYRTIIEPGTEAMVVVPYNNQCQIVYDKITRFINSSPYLLDVFDGSTKHPFAFRWKSIGGNTPGQIKIFTAGASSGGTADSIRGQTIKWLYVDEADYIPSTALDAIMSVTNRYGDEARTWISSTPSGARSYFFDLCQNPRWTEFHYTSHVSPTWTREQDLTMKETLGTTGYTHEIMAAFGTKEQGIFRKKHIQQAFTMNKLIEDDTGNLSGYGYDDFESISKQMMTYIIGVDWNSAVFGTQIVLCGIHSNGKIFLLKHKEIKGEEFTQMSAVETIMQWNLAYNPIKIYVDEGFGGMQIETMHRHGKMNPSTKLDERVVPVNFSSNIDVWDPITEEMVPKYSKGFIVDNTARLLEQGMIVLPENEKAVASGDKSSIELALTNYTLKKISNSGRPVFECPDALDHKLDALMLVCLAYSQHYKRIADMYFGFKPAKPVVIEKDIRQNSNKYAEARIIRRTLSLGMGADKRNIKPFDPTKDDVDLYFKRMQLGHFSKKVQRKDGQIGPRQRTSRISRVIQRTGRF